MLLPPESRFREQKGSVWIKRDSLALVCWFCCCTGWSQIGQYLYLGQGPAEKELGTELADLILGLGRGVVDLRWRKWPAVKGTAAVEKRTIKRD